MTLALHKIQALRDRSTLGKKLSIYIPTHPKSNSQSINEDTTRFKNALQDLKNNPLYDDSVLGNTMQSLYKLLDNTEFWKYQDVGLAVFGDAKGYEYFHIQYEMTAATYLTDDFIVSPLIISQSISSGFYVLDINLKKPQLRQAKNGTLVDVDVTNMPESFEDTVARDEYKIELQHQATLRSSNGGGGGFHGHDPAEAIDDDTAKYLRLIAKATDEYLHDHTEPLILAGTENRIGNLRQHLTYNAVLEDSVTGNQESLSAQQLYDASIDIATMYYDAQRKASIEKLLSSAPEFVVIGASEIYEAAAAGRIERLYVPVYRHTTDTVRAGDFASIILQLPDDIAELEKLVNKTLAQGGEILATEIDSYEGSDEPRALCRF